MSTDLCIHEMVARDCAYCAPHERKLRPDSDIVARFPARFDSDCDDCGEDMYEGDPICRTRDGDYIHESCAEPWPGLAEPVDWIEET